MDIVETLREGGIRRRRRGRERRGGRGARARAQARRRGHGHQDARHGWHHGGRDHRQENARARGAADRLLADGARRARARRWRHGVRRQAVHALRTCCQRWRLRRSRYSEIEQLESEIADITERMETRKKVERAKGLLMENMQLNEPESLPLDPEDVDGPPAHDARGRRGRHRSDGARSRSVAGRIAHVSRAVETACRRPRHPRFPRDASLSSARRCTASAAPVTTPSRTAR